MSYFAAVVLGVVQGLTEFLPISSTAHVALAARALGLPDQGMAAYTAVIQLGTLVAVLAYFARDLWQIAAATLGALLRPRELLALLSPRAGEDAATAERHLRARLGIFIVLGTVPIGVCGVVFKKLIEHQLRSPLVMAGSLVGLALVLYVAERVASHRRGIAELGPRDALVVGCAQALALVPGASRSGVTLTAGLLCGLKRDDAARYSFLLSVPAVLAAAVFEMKDALKAPTLGAHGLGVVLVGTAAAFVVGYATIAWLLRFLSTRTTLPFVWYRLFAGTVLFVLVVSGVMK